MLFECLFFAGTIGAVGAVNNDNRLENYDHCLDQRSIHREGHVHDR